MSQMVDCQSKRVPWNDRFRKRHAASPVIQEDSHVHAVPRSDCSQDTAVCVRFFLKPPSNELFGSLFRVFASLRSSCVRDH